jgi:hypothetical protein
VKRICYTVGRTYKSNYKACRADSLAELFKLFKSFISLLKEGESISIYVTREKMDR